MPRLSAFIRSRLAVQQTAPADHPRAGVLAAFVEQNLSTPEHKNVLGHLAHCPECRQVLALLSAAESEQVSPVFEPAHHRSAWWAWCSVAAAMLACLIGAVIWRASLKRHAPLPPELLAHVSVPQLPATPIPNPIKLGVPEPPQAKRRPLVEKPPTIETTTITAAWPQPNSTFLQKRFKESLMRTAPQPTPTFQVESQPARPELAFAMPQPQQARSLWRLSGNRGTLEKSHDGGVTWQPIPLYQGTPFYSLSANGANIWVGGAGGTLFHSNDGGLNWKRVRIIDINVAASGAITKIESRGPYTLRVVTSSGDRWITTDAGLHWQHE